MDKSSVNNSKNSKNSKNKQNTTEEYIDEDNADNADGENEPTPDYWSEGYIVWRQNALALQVALESLTNILADISDEITSNMETGHGCTFYFYLFSFYCLYACLLELFLLFIR